MISDSSLNAADVKTVNDATSGTIDISNASSISGTTSDVLDIVNDNGATFTTATDYAVTLSDTASISNTNTILGDTSGVVTATVASDTVANLNNGLTNATSSDKLSLTVTDTSIDASDLNTLDTKTSEDIDVSSVTDISGSVSDIKTLYDNSVNFRGIGYEDITVSSSGSYNATDILDFDTSGKLNLASGDDTITFDNKTEFDNFKNKFSDIIDAGGNDTIKFASSSVSGDLDFGKLTEFENLELSSTNDSITLSGDEPSNVKGLGGDDSFTLDFSKVSSFTTDGGSGSDTVSITGDTGSDITSDTAIGFYSNLNNIETIDFTNLTFNVGSDTSDGGTKADYVFNGEWIHTISSNDEITLILDSDDAGKLEFRDNNNVKYGGDDSDANTITNGTYTLHDDADNLDVTLHITGL